MNNIQEELLQAFRQSTIDSISKECSTEVTSLGRSKRGETKQQPCALAASIGLVGANYGGSANLLFPAATFLNLISCMVGEEITTIDNEIEDGAAELLNIIFGGAKVSLNEKGHQVAMAIPTLLKGSPVGFEYPHTQGAFIESFSIPAGEFYLEVALEVKPQGTLSEDNGGSPETDVVKFFQPFAEGAKKTFQVLLELEITPGKPKLKDPAKPDHFEVAGFVGIISASFIGSFTLCFPRESFLKIISKMVGEEITTLDVGIADGAAEIVNIIFGHAKTILNERGNALQMAIPTVIQGAGIDSRQQSSQSVVVVPFTSDEGPFWLEMAWEPTK